MEDYYSKYNCTVTASLGCWLKALTLKFNLDYEPSSVISCEALANLLSLSEPQCPHLENKEKANNSTSLKDKH